MMRAGIPPAVLMLSCFPCAIGRSASDPLFPEPGLLMRSQDICRTVTTVIAARCIFIIAGLALCLPAAAEPEPGAVDPGVRAELQALVDTWVEAEVRDDRRALEDILHEDFLSTFASGKTLDRSAYIDFIVALDISPFTVRNESIRQHGDTVVVIDVSESGATKFTWIAVRRDGDWKVISQTFSTVTAPEAN